jgi:hypothetical protein
MGYWRRNGKRFITDAGGYLLLIAAALTGWLPGPGGIPLALAGLGLLSINNKWARDLRDYVLKHGGRVIEIIFPRNSAVEWAYDTIVILLLILSSMLIWQHGAIWQISLAIVGYFTALFIALMNRDRAGVKRRRHKKTSQIE